MRFLIYGVSETGRKALNYLGIYRTKAFVETQKSRDDFEGIIVISLAESLSLNQDEYIYVVCAEIRHEEIVKNLRKNNIKNWFRFTEYDYLYMENNCYPTYMLYGKRHQSTFTEILNIRKINQYKRIIVYGYSPILPFILSEIAFQVGTISRIVGIIRDEAGQFEENYYGFGLPEVTIDEAEQIADCIILCKSRASDGIYGMIEKRLLNLDVIDLYDEEYYLSIFRHDELKCYKNVHAHEACFIVGNGPSLNINDLDRIYERKIVSFASNTIYNIFDKTKWRPTYYCASDLRLLEEVGETIKEKIDSVKFIVDDYNWIGTTREDDYEYIHCVFQEFNENLPRFSDDITKGIYWGRTVTYDILQIACYMGFDKIYLIGMDNRYSGRVDSKNNHFKDAYKYTVDISNHSNLWLPPVDICDRWNRAYRAAREFAEKNSIKIYNATRGGELNVFERVDIEELFG